MSILLDRFDGPRRCLDDLPELGLRHVTWDVAEEHLGARAFVVFATPLAMALGILLAPIPLLPHDVKLEVKWRGNGLMGAGSVNAFKGGPWAMLMACAAGF